MFHKGGQKAERKTNPCSERREIVPRKNDRGSGCGKIKVKITRAGEAGTCARRKDKRLTKKEEKMYGAETKRITMIQTPDSYVGKIVGGRKLNNASLALASAAYSFTKCGGYGEKFVDMVKTLGFGRTSLFSAAKFLQENNFITRNERGGFEVTDPEAAGKGYDEKDFELRDTPFLFFDKQTGKSVTRKMSATEFNVLSRIRRHNFNEKTSCFKGSYASMVHTMAYSEPTLRRAISALIGAGLIVISEKRRIAHYNELTIKVSEKLIRKKKKEHKEAEKAARKQEKSVKTFISADVLNADQRADRERYYSNLRDLTLRRAENVHACASKNARFAQIERELKQLDIEIAKDEVFATGKSAELLARKSALQKERSGLLLKMRIKPEELEQKAFCERCSDTGFLPNGLMCDCYGLHNET